MLKYYRVAREFGGGTKEEVKIRPQELSDSPNVRWRIAKIEFAVPYNVFKVVGRIDGNVFINGIIDQHNYLYEPGKYGVFPEVREEIHFLVENRTSDTFTFTVVLLVDEVMKE